MRPVDFEAKFALLSQGPAPHAGPPTNLEVSPPRLSSRAQRRFSDAGRLMMRAVYRHYGQRIKASGPADDGHTDCECGAQGHGRAPKQGATPPPPSSLRSSDPAPQNRRAWIRIQAPPRSTDQKRPTIFLFGWGCRQAVEVSYRRLLTASIIDCGRDTSRTTTESFSLKCGGRSSTSIFSSASALSGLSVPSFLFGPLNSVPNQKTR